MTRRLPAGHALVNAAGAGVQLVAANTRWVCLTAFSAHRLWLSSAVVVLRCGGSIVARAGWVTALTARSLGARDVTALAAARFATIGLDLFGFVHNSTRYPGGVSIVNRSMAAAHCGASTHDPPITRQFKNRRSRAVAGIGHVTSQFPDVRRRANVDEWPDHPSVLPAGHADQGARSGSQLSRSAPLRHHEGAETAKPTNRLRR